MTTFHHPPRKIWPLQSPHLPRKIRPLQSVHPPRKIPPLLLLLLLLQRKVLLRLFQHRQRNPSAARRRPRPPAMPRLQSLARMEARWRRTTRSVSSGNCALTLPVRTATRARQRWSQSIWRRDPPEVSLNSLFVCSRTFWAWPTDDGALRYDIDIRIMWILCAGEKLPYTFIFLFSFIVFWQLVQNVYRTTLRNVPLSLWVSELKNMSSENMN